MIKDQYEDFVTNPYLISLIKELVDIKKKNKPIKIIIYKPYSKDSKSKVYYTKDIQSMINKIELKIVKYINKYYPDIKQCL